jgi:hypothetical protein
MLLYILLKMFSSEYFIISRLRASRNILPAAAGHIGCFYAIERMRGMRVGETMLR